MFALVTRLRALPYRWLVALVFIFGLSMDMVDSTVVNVAVPRLSQEFHASTTAVEWTVTGYLLSLAVFIPAAGYLSDRFGTKRCFLIAMGIFVAASGFCGQAHSLAELVAFRFVQGLGGGMMTPVGTAMLSREFPGPERAKASAIMSVPIVFAPLVGPILGGYLVSYASWRWIFYLNLPIGIVGFVFAYRVLREHKEAYARTGFDLLGLLLGSASASLVLYSLSEAATAGWVAPRVVTTGLGGLALGVGFVLQELHAKPPIIDVRLFKRPLFAQGNLVMLPAFAMMSGLNFVLTLYLQELQGWSPFQAGMITAPAAIFVGLSLPFASHYYPLLGPKRMLLTGCILSFVMAIPFGFLTAGTAVWIIIVLVCLRRVAFPFASVAAQTIMYGPLESEKQGAASSAYNTVRQAAASIGVAMVATVATTQYHSKLASLTASHHLVAPTADLARQASQWGYQMAFFSCTALTVIPIIVALTVSNERAKDSLRHRVEEVAHLSRETAVDVEPVSAAE